MKTAIYIEDGTVQLVITPESEFEKNALRSFEENSVDATPVEAEIFIGSFYDCRGGWVSQSHHSSGHPHASDERSLILKAKPKSS